MSSEDVILIDMYLDALSKEIKASDSRILEDFPASKFKEANENGILSAKFIKKLSLFLTSFLVEYDMLNKIDAKKPNPLIDYLDYLLLITEVDNVEILKICLLYWKSIARKLYLLEKSNQAKMIRSFYKGTLTRVRRIIISKMKMAKPKEFFVMNNRGEVVRVFTNDTDSINFYENMTELLFYLTHLDCDNTVLIITDLLNRILNRIDSEWSWMDLNTVCWALSSVFGSTIGSSFDLNKRFTIDYREIPEHGKTRLLQFFGNVIDWLLTLKKNNRNVNEKIIVYNIIYIVDQYPEFVNQNFKLFKTEDLVNMVIEHIAVKNEAQDMACDALLKLARQNLPAFKKPLIESLMQLLVKIPESHKEKINLFECVGIFVSKMNDKENFYITQYLELMNTPWKSAILTANRDRDMYKEIDVLKTFEYSLKLNSRACNALGHLYIKQSGDFYSQVLDIYRVMSNILSEEIEQKGDRFTKEPLFKQIRAVKKESLNLINKWISKHCTSKNTNLLDFILLDYRQSFPEPEVLTIMATIVDRFDGSISEKIPSIFNELFCIIEFTFLMIYRDTEQQFRDYLDKFLLLIHALIMKEHRFNEILKFKDSKLKLILDSIIWAIEIGYEIGFVILLNLLENVRKHSEAQWFYSKYYIQIIQRVFLAVSDLSEIKDRNYHYHQLILGHMFALLNNSNKELVVKHISNLMKIAYPHHQDVEIQVIKKALLFSVEERNLRLLVNDKRPFVISIFIGYDRDVTNNFIYQFYQSDHSNYGWEATCFESTNRQEISSIDKTKLDDALHLAITILCTNFAELNDKIKQLPLATHEEDNTQSPILIQQELNELINQLNDKQRQQAAHVLASSSIAPDAAQALIDENRSFGISILMGSSKKFGFKLYQSNLSGNYRGWKAQCIENKKAISIMKKIGETKLADAVQIALKVLHNAKKNSNIELLSKKKLETLIKELRKEDSHVYHNIN